MKKHRLLQYLLPIVSLVLFIECNNKKSNLNDQPKLNNTKNMDSLTPPNLDDNIYFQIIIGGQIWMTTNLDKVVFRNGDTIPEASTNKEWKDAIKNKLPVWCHAPNTKGDSIAKGKIYNFYAVSDKRGIAPEGWRVPNNYDWSVLVNFLNVEHKSLSNIDKDFHWEYLPDTINSRGFNVINGGYRYQAGEFYSINKNSFYWTSEGSLVTNALKNRLLFNYGSIIRVKDYSGFGFYIRCVK